jgi:D-amino-acid dehydrogenase
LEEPSVSFQVQQPTTAKYEFEAKSASSERFTKELARRCASDPALDVSFLYNTKVKAITVKNPESSAGGTTKPRITELKTNRGIIQVPENVKVVVAAGSWTPHVLALMDLYAPVYPLKGYAISVSAAEAIQDNPSLKPQDLPSRIVSDKYMYTSRLGDEIRITSIGEFSGWSTKPTPNVDTEFRHEAIRQFPQLQNLINEAPTRCGHRPYVNDGILLLGAVDTHENLFVSCGPGSNGWKLAMGSGEVIVRLVSGQTTDQIAQDLKFDASAFSPAGRVLKAPIFAKLCRARWDV